MNIKFNAILLSFLIAFSLTSHFSFTQSNRGRCAVVTEHPEATKIGLQILNNEGNAYDAAVAVGFALAVCYPVAGNLGGGGFMVHRDKNGKTETLDFRETAASSASRDMYLDKDGKALISLSKLGHLSVGVPGTVKGLLEIHEKYASLPLSILMQPAIDLARKGSPITYIQAGRLNKDKELFLQVNDKPTPFTKGTKWQKGDRIVHRELASTLERIMLNGADEFYSGHTAELFVNEMAANGGIITKEDLQSYRCVWRTPITVDYKQYKIITMPPPSSGGICVLQLLNLVEQHAISTYRWQSPEAIHLLTEAERRIYADRAHFLGDPDFTDIPIQALLSDEYLADRMQDFDPKKASKSAEVSEGQIHFDEAEETTHYSIVDSKGNAVALTTTLNLAYGSKVYVDGAGFLLNCQMDDFSIKPGTPNAWGLVGNEANAIAANKRMLSSMSPTIVEKDNDLYMILGSPGGSTIITSIFQVLLNTIEFNMTLEEAVQAPRVHHQWKPDKLFFEIGGLNNFQHQKLKELGHTPQQRSLIGSVQAIIRNPDGTYTGVADYRRDGKSDNCKIKIIKN